MTTNTELPNVMRAPDWGLYLRDNKFIEMGQAKLYHSTYKHTTIYKLGDYYFCFHILRGYKNLSALKGVITRFLAP
jgi:hypothetical protein